MCTPCCKERVKAEEELRQRFKNATIYVLKVTDHNQILAGPGEAVAKPSEVGEDNDNEEEYVEVSEVLILYVRHLTCLKLRGGVRSTVLAG